MISQYGHNETMRDPIFTYSSCITIKTNTIKLKFDIKKCKCVVGYFYIHISNSYSNSASVYHDRRPTHTSISDSVDGVGTGRNKKFLECKRTIGILVIIIDRIEMMK